MRVKRRERGSESLIERRVQLARASSLVLCGRKRPSSGRRRQFCPKVSKLRSLRVSSEFSSWLLSFKECPTNEEAGELERLARETQAKPLSPFEQELMSSLSESHSTFYSNQSGGKKYPQESPKIEALRRLAIQIPDASSSTDVGTPTFPHGL